MPSLSWLHVTDLHRGLAGQRERWPSVRQAFYDDLSRLAERAGPWDLVFFTGDLTQRGSVEEFVRLEETLHGLFAHLETLGSRPGLLTIPGNHDLVRPKVNAVLRALRNWHNDPELREEFWSDPKSEYHTLLREAFAAYEAFVARWPLPAHCRVRTGVVPGDRSFSLLCDGLQLAVVGLNSAFLQLEGGDYKGRLDLDARQLLGVCGDDPGLFVDDHHLALLLTHHPSEWLHSRALPDFRADIAPPGRFMAHLFGHMHEPSTRTLSVGGTASQREWQGPSLFGMERYGDDAYERIHGYIAGRITVSGSQATATLWPRVSSRNLAGAWQIVPDHNRFQLDDTNAMSLDGITVRRPRSDAVLPSLTPSLAGRSDTVAAAPPALVGAPPPPTTTSTPLPIGLTDERAAFEAIVRLLPAQFEVLLLHLGVAVHMLPPSTAPQGIRAVGLVRLLAQRGELGKLADALAAL